MKMHHAFTLSCLLVLVLVICASADDVQGKTNSNPSVDVKTPEIVEPNNTAKVEPHDAGKKSSPVVKEKTEGSGSNGGIQNGSDANKQASKKVTQEGDKGSSDGKTEGKESGQEEKTKTVGEQKEKPNTGKGESSGGSTTGSEKVKPQDEECDMPNRCSDKENKLVACLRVPGNDSPNLSLLIQNKGKGTMVVKILVPPYVEVEKTRIELKDNENQKLKVSYKEGGKKGSILLTTSSGRCSLSLNGLIANHGGVEVPAVSKSNYLIFLTQTKSLSFAFLAAIVIIASVGVWVTLQRRRHLATVSNYQKLDTELPVSNGRKEIAEASDVNDGWDNSWDDNWDDEEAPLSPMPVTPSLSSKGLVPRKLNKD